MSQIVNDVTLKCVTKKTITPPIYRIILFKGVLTYELDICLTSDFDINTLIGLTFEQAATIIDTQNKAYCSNKYGHRELWGSTLSDLGLSYHRSSL